MAKWLKQSIECILDAFELYPSSSANQENSDGLFETVETANWDSWWGKNKITRFAVSHVMIARQLDKFVSDKNYDIIHVHGVWFYLPYTKRLKQHTKNLFVSFWGSEHKNGKTWFSHSLFDKQLKKFMDSVDGIAGTKARLEEMHKMFPKTTMYQALLGAASMETILDLTKTQPKSKSKQYWGIDKDKVTVLIGYSGKQLHNHLDIIEKFNNHLELKDTIHLLAPMTRGANTGYVQKVEDALKNSLFSYTLLKNRFLTDEDIAQLRYATDIVFQFATFDAYSRSIIECLSAGAILVYGDWIKYQQLLSDDHFEAFVASDIEKGIEIVQDYIQSKDKYSVIAERNIQSGGRKFLWSECIKDWVKIYKGEKNAEVF